MVRDRPRIPTTDKMSTLSKAKDVSSCCKARVKPNMVKGGYFCDKCGGDCASKREAPKGRKVTGEAEDFKKVWGRCNGYSEVDKSQKLLPPDHPMWTWQFSHCLPKGSYQDDRNKLVNIVACTVKEHTEEWPLVKEKTDAELKTMGMDKWIPVVTMFRAMRLAYSKRLTAEIAGKA